MYKYALGLTIAASAALLMGSSQARADFDNSATDLQNQQDEMSYDMDCTAAANATEPMCVQKDFCSANLNAPECKDFCAYFPSDTSCDQQQLSETPGFNRWWPRPRPRPFPRRGWCYYHPRAPRCRW